MSNQSNRLTIGMIATTCLALIISFRTSMVYADASPLSAECMQVAEFSSCDNRIPVSVMPGLDGVLAKPTSARDAALNKFGYLHLVLSLEGVDRGWATSTETLIQSALLNKSMLKSVKTSSETIEQSVISGVQTANVVCARTLCEVQYRVGARADIDAIINVLRSMSREPITENLLASLSKNTIKRTVEEKTFGQVIGGIAVSDPKGGNIVGVEFLLRNIEMDARASECVAFWSISSCSVSKPLPVALGFESFLKAPTNATSAGVRGAASLLHLVVASEARDDSWAQLAEGTLRQALLEQLSPEEGSDAPPMVTLNVLECRATLCEVQVTANSNRTLNRWVQKVVDTAPEKAAPGIPKLFTSPVIKEFVTTVGQGIGTRAVLYFQRV